jgi:hypothetical protein
VLLVRKHVKPFQRLVISMKEWKAVETAGLKDLPGDTWLKPGVNENCLYIFAIIDFSKQMLCGSFRYAS